MKKEMRAVLTISTTRRHSWFVACDSSYWSNSFREFLPPVLFSVLSLALQFWLYLYSNIFKLVTTTAAHWFWFVYRSPFAGVRFSVQTAISWRVGGRPDRIEISDFTRDIVEELGDALTGYYDKKKHPLLSHVVFYLIFLLACLTEWKTGFLLFFQTR